jgi:hypothetical protein
LPDHRGWHILLRTPSTSSGVSNVMTHKQNVLASAIASATFMVILLPDAASAAQAGVDYADTDN